MKGEWDPFTEHEFVSNGTGLDLEGTPVPAKGTVVKPAGEKPTDEWLLTIGRQRHHESNALTCDVAPIGSQLT